MLSGGKQVSAPQQLLVGVRMVLSQLLYYRLKPNHCWSGPESGQNKKGDHPAKGVT